MLYFNQETRQFADAKVGGATTPKTHIGSLTLTFPLRKYRIDKKGRKRHERYGLNIDLMGGPGALQKRSAIEAMKKELGDEKITSMTLTPAKLQKILKIIKGK